MAYRPFRRAVLALLICSPALAAQSDVDPAIAPYILSNTLVVARLDVTRLNIDAVMAHQDYIFRQALWPDESFLNSAVYHQAVATIGNWVGDFLHVGGRTIDAEILMGDPANMLVVVVPLQHGADSGAIRSLLVSGRTNGPQEQAAMKAVVMNNAVVLASPWQLDKLQTAKAVDATKFAVALATVGDVPFKAAFVPNPAFKLLAGQTLPNQLPGKAGGILTFRLVQGLNFAAVGTTPPPTASGRLIVQCSTPAAAQAYADLTDALLEQFRDVPQNVATMRDLDLTIESVRPRVAGSTMTISIDQPTAEGLEEPIVYQSLAAVPQAQQAQAPKSPLAIAMGQGRQLGIGVIMYADSHNGKYPDKLDDIASQLGGKDALAKLLDDARVPDAHPGFLYVKPTSSSNPSQTVMIYEAKGRPTVVAVFMDGHVQAMRQNRLDTLLKNQLPPQTGNR